MIRLRSDGLTPEILMENVDEIEARKFNSNECSQIKNIYYMAKEGYRSREWIPLGMDQSMSICSDAKDLNMPLKEYLCAAIDTVFLTALCLGVGYTIV